MPSIGPAQHAEIIEHLLGSLDDDADGVVSSEEFDRVRVLFFFFFFFDVFRTVSHVNLGFQRASPPMCTVTSSATLTPPFLVES